MSPFHGDGQLLDLIEQQVRLPSPPAIVVQILNTVQKDESSLQELAKIIAADPALTAKLLRIANSGVYHLQHEVTSIERALSVLGTNVVKNIALSFVIASDLRGNDRSLFDFDYFWRRSVTAGVAAELLTNMLRQRNEDIFVTALLQDIGILVMGLSKGEEYCDLLEERLTTDVPLCELEKNRFGFDHQQLGATLLKSWQLPDVITEPLRFHHDTSAAPEVYLPTAEILRISSLLSAIYNEPNGAEKARLLQEEVPLRFDLDPNQVRELIDDVATKSCEIMESFDLQPGEMKPYSQMLQEANEELGRLNLTYEQLVMELKEAKDKAENLANDLHAANNRLKELVFRDGLTGLYNHRYFQEILSRELARALRYQSPLALIMFDIDFFKKVNDNYGHVAGDQVLKNIALAVEGAVRASDFIARYGGEEFAVILPQTNQAGMKVFAERMRRSVEEVTTIAEGLEIKVTISSGGACWTPDNPSITKENLIGTADRALYMSKHNGRNQSTVLVPSKERA